MYLLFAATLIATVLGYETKISSYEAKISEVRTMAIDNVELYNDLCAEARPCQDYESEYCTDKAADARGSASLLIDMHYEGVACASENILMILD